VAFLMTFPGISTTVRNRYGNTPAEVVCQNARNSSPAVTQRIKELLRGKYKIMGSRSCQVWFHNLPRSLGIGLLLSREEQVLLV